jgi:hypothetical protein
MMMVAHRRSRAGIAQMYLIAGGVVAAGLLGYLLYKHYKDSHPGGASGGQSAQYGRSFQGGPVSYGIPDPRQMTKGRPPFAPGAPQTGSENQMPQAPELKEEENPYTVGDAGLAELQANARRANMALSVSLASGNVAGAALCRDSLEHAQGALESRKRDLLR